jgi:DNA-binding transcriptional regulator YiaG
MKTNKQKKARKAYVVKLTTTTPAGRALTRPVRLSVASRLDEMFPTLERMNDVERLSSEDIGPRLGVTPQTVRSWYATLGIKLHNFKSWNRVDRTAWAEKIPPLRRQGLTYQQIAERMGTDATSVCRWCLNTGLTKSERDCR